MTFGPAIGLGVFLASIGYAFHAPFMIIIGGAVILYYFAEIMMEKPEHGEEGGEE